MNKSFPYRLLPSIFFAIVIFSLTACSQGTQHWNATNIRGILPDLAFTLIDQNNHIVTEKKYSDKINILFFGYTNCPDVCPYTLGKLAAILHKMPINQRKNFNVLFVSVDPARDTVAIRKRYTAAFGPEFIGLSGTMKQLKKINRRYRVTFGYGKKDKQGYYVVSHSSAIYIFDSKNHARLLATNAESIKDLTEDLQQLQTNL